MVNDKFVLVSMNDDRTKKIADVLGNKTCKKIIDYLADHEEMSAKDLSDGLKIPLNTLDYNMKKLLDSELVKKTKNFFWSKKGKKIVMYELSTGRRPFEGNSFDEIVTQQLNVLVKSPRFYNQEMSKDLENIILRALNVDPAKRYQCVGELVLDIKRGM